MQGISDYYRFLDGLEKLIEAKIEQRELPNEPTQNGKKIRDARYEIEMSMDSIAHSEES
jgi:hypothetical protein